MNRSDTSFLGLGYNRREGQQQQEQEQQQQQQQSVAHAPSASYLFPYTESYPPQNYQQQQQSNADCAANAAQALMLQCLAYHQEQEAIRQYQQSEEQQKEVKQSSESFPQFVPSSLKNEQQSQLAHDLSQQQHQAAIPQQSDDFSSCCIKQEEDFPPEYNSASNNERHTKIDDSKHQEALIEEAKARAQSVLARFQQQQPGLAAITTDLPTSSINSGTSTAAEAAAAPGEDGAPVGVPQQLLHPPEYYAQQRQIGLQREEQRKHRALLKNFEYVVHKESERIGRLQAAQDQVAQWEQISQQQYQQNLEQRRQLLLQSRQKHDQQGKNNKSQRPQKGARNHPHQQPEQEPKSLAIAATVAIYVSGFPVAEPNVVSEAFVRQLFGAYGKISRVHFYRNRCDQSLKGDGLIVYAVDELDQRGNDGATQLLESVCVQVSELL